MQIKNCLEKRMGIFLYQEAFELDDENAFDGARLEKLLGVWCRWGLQNQMSLSMRK